MAEYIDREKARDAVYARIYELKDDKEFNIAKEICISGVEKYINAIPTADVVSREEYNKMVQSFRDRNENLKRNLINTRDSYFKLEKEISELEIKIDKAIEEIEQAICSYGFCFVSRGMNLALDILKKNIGESK